MENFIQEAFLTRQHAFVVYLDLEKAYDLTWRHNILETLHKWGLRGHLPIFISSFMQDRRFRVRIGDHLSDSFIQENGIPQGSV